VSSHSPIKNGFILAIFALITTGLTSVTWLMTKEQIRSEKEKALLRAISELVPSKLYHNDPYHDCTLLNDPELLGSNEAQHAWRLRDDKGLPVAVLISSVAPNGYNGAIEILVGHYIKNNVENNKLAGVRVTAHKETPGLGDKIDVRKHQWIVQFTDTLTNRINLQDWRVKKDGGKYDAFTGATITPRAVLSAIAKNITYFNNHQQQIFSAPANCPVGENND